MGYLQFDTKVAEQLEGVEKKKFIQQIRIVKTLYVDGPQTTAKLCKRLRISTPNMVAIMAEMFERNILEKKGQGKSIGGRKPDLYGLVADSFYILAVEMSIYKVSIAIFNAENNQITETEEYSVELNNKKETLDEILELINSYIDRSGLDKSGFLSVGISMPGLVDSVKGINYTYLNFGDKPVTELMEESIGCPVFVENDAKAMALAEFRLGSAKGKKDILVLYLDWGIGLGMILNGNLYRGTSGFAGEFSHIPMVENGKLCRCGKLGCIETVASGIRVLELAEEGVKEGKTSIKLDTKNPNIKSLELKNIIKSALGGDQYAIKILHETGLNLGKAISILIQLFNPELIVLCGMLAQSGDLITTPIRQGINTHAMKQISEQSKIVATQFGANIGMLGAVAVVMENAFEKYLTN